MPKPTRIVYSKYYIPTMDVNIALLRFQKRSCEVRYAADKTPLQRLYYMSCRTAVALAGFGVFDGAKLRRLFELAKK